MYTAQLEVLEFWVPSTTKFRKNGEPALFPNIIRKLFLSNPSAIVDPQEYKITQVRRSGGITYAISGLVSPKKPLWAMPILDTRVLPTAKWRKVENSMNRENFLVWLSKRIPNAGLVLRNLETAEPTNRKERNAA